MIFARFITLLSLLAITACTQFPQLDGTVAPEIENAAFPELLPLEPILSQTAGGVVDPVREETNLQGRLAGLRGRANRLRGSVLTSAEKRRLEQGLS
jgi:hypothetical protein